MKLLSYTFRNIRHRLFLSLLTALSIAATVAFILLFSLFRSGVEQGAEKGYGPFDLVIGAAGSETQLVLNTFYHIGAPTGNIPLSVLDQVRSDSGVDKAFAFTTGDRMHGFPVVGIDPGYFPVRYGDRKLSAGRLYAQTGEAVLGWQAAKESGLHVGDSFTGAHGLVEEAGESFDHDEAGGSEHDEEHESEEHAHESFRYTVAGILPRLNTPDDRAVFTTVDYAWAVHHLEGADREITAVLVKPSSLLGAHTLKETLGQSALGVQAVYTSKAVADVVNTVDQGSRLVSLITGLCVILASITILLSLIAATGERTKDAGLLRLLGKPKGYVWLTVMSEGLLLTGAGLVSGLLSGHLVASIIRETVFAKIGVQLHPWAWSPDQSLLAIGTLAIGLAASLLSAFRLYRMQPLALFSRANLVLLTLAISLPLLLSACGNSGKTEEAGSFREAVSSPAEVSSSPAGNAETSSVPGGEKGTSAASSSPASPAPLSATGSASPAAQDNGNGEQLTSGGVVETEPNASSAGPGLSPSASAGTAETVGASPAAGSHAPGKPNPAGAAKESASPAGKPPLESGKPAGSAGTGSPSPTASSEAGSKSPASSPKGEKESSGPVAIGWSDFFDGTDQTKPSERFWDLSEDDATVTIKGFMGEVLSFEKHWFLLIPAPGAECPFDNGDETYWNKIMIVFVSDGQKLRYKSGPLEITGRLDVGIKVDESGYKTMFRLYDASFKEITP
ncbi:ABC transporter permease [Gorillibacterium timonense]|uniref:ABC transporter permease n=1 Tax=Gorillibacterium timonense TaxID=1689269 RepID=UPI000AFF4722|nr:FtsX-like permease family protein [Gorillibacterium timonense]